VIQVKAVDEDLLPIAHTPRQARNIVTEACARWDVDHLVGPATLIISELVTNVIDHAHTMTTVHVALHGSCLYLSIQDGSTTPPALRRGDSPSARGGRGLQLVAAVSIAWGYTAEDGGKTVWATLALDLTSGHHTAHRRPSPSDDADRTQR
jgi:two-component sensor histidine kinase